MFCAQSSCVIHCVERKSTIDRKVISFCFCDELADGEAILHTQYSYDEGLDIWGELTPTEDSTSVVVGGGESGKTYRIACQVDTNLFQRLNKVCMLTVYQCGPEVVVTPSEPILSVSMVSAHAIGVTITTDDQGYLDVDNQSSHSVTTTLSGSGVLNANNESSHGGTVTLLANGSLDVDNQSSHAGTSTLLANGSLDVDNQSSHSGTATLQGPAPTEGYVLSPTLNASNQVTTR